MRTSWGLLVGLVACGTDSDGPRPPDPCIADGTCPPGVSINVTPPEMDPAVLAPTENAYGPGVVVADPAHPTDLYVGGGDDGVWKSTDYGNTWTQIDDTIPGVARGTTLAVAGTTPATVWVAAAFVPGLVYKSVDGGATFTLIGNNEFGSELYSIEVDPNDPDHLISGLHEADGIVESVDGGASWRLVGGTGFPSGGVSWYPFFVDAGDALSTSRTWFAIAQGGGTPVMTDDRGATWTQPAGLDGLKHPHGNSQIYQDGADVFVAGTEGPGQGVYRSADRGASWARVSNDTPEAVVWGTPTGVYAMWAWACSNCDLGTNFLAAPRPGTTWSTVDVTPDLRIGASRVAVTHDGTHHVFVGVMWTSGIWRYVEP